MARRSSSSTLLALALTLAPALTLDACATPKPPVYGPIGDAQPFGYKDRPTGDGSFTLLTVVPAYASLTEAQAFWTRRAEELCPSGISRRIIFRVERKENMTPAGYVYGGTGVSSRFPLAYEVEGYLYCNATPPASSGPR